MGWLQQPHSRKEGRKDCSVLALSILSDGAVFDQARGQKGLRGTKLLSLCPWIGSGAVCTL